MSRLFLLILLFTGCGTETGNPLQDILNEYNGDPDTAQANRSTYVAEALGEQVCEKLVSCNMAVLSQTVCHLELNLQGGFDTELGLVDGEYATFADILVAEKAKVLIPNKIESAQCLIDIGKLKCNDSEIINAFDKNSPNDFSNIHTIIPVGAGSCNSMF